MIKKLLLIIIFFILAINNIQLFPAHAQSDLVTDFPRCSAGKVCLASSGQKTLVWTSACASAGNSCYATATTTSTGACSCGGSPTCNCHIFPPSSAGNGCYWRNSIDERCACLISGKLCTTNQDCNAGSLLPGVYDENDICECTSGGLNCSVAYGAQTFSCCFSDTGNPTNAPAPTSTPVPTSPPPLPTDNPPTAVPTRQIQVTVNFYRSDMVTYNAANNSCSHTSATDYSDGVLFQSRFKENPTINHGLISSQTYSFDVAGARTGDSLNLTANTNDLAYSCTCPAGCSYALQVPAGDTLTRNFYFYNYSEAWFQTFGASTFNTALFRSLVPNTTSCSLPACQAGAFVPQPAGNNLSSGFPLLNVVSTNSIRTNNDPSDYLANIHLAGQRTSSQNEDAYAVGFGAQSLSYDYFKQLANNSSQTIREQSLAQTNLATWRSNGWLPSGQTSFFEVNGDLTIDQSKNFAVDHGERAVVFVNGTLTIDNTGASDAKVISVARKTSVNAGGLLAFFTTGDIIIRSNVGTTLDPVALNNPIVNFNSAHLEGVFFSNQRIIVNGQQQDGAIAGYPDRKLIAAGTFIGLEGISLYRQTDDGTPATETYRALNNIQALENFLYRPDLLINWPDELKSSVLNWRELAPRSFDN